MVKSLCVLVGGVFVGAVGMEILHRTYPNAMGKLYSRAHEAASGAREAFRAGYESAAKPHLIVESSA